MLTPPLLSHSLRRSPARLVPGALIAFIDDAARTQKLESWFRYAFGSVILWFVFGPLWRLVFFRRSAPS